MTTDTQQKRQLGKAVAQWALFAALMGVVCGAAAVLLSFCTDVALDVYGKVPVLICALPLLGCLTLLLYRKLNVDVSTNTSTVINAARHNEPVDVRLAPAIFLGTCLTVISGGSVGKEAAALQLGGSLGSWLGKRFGFHGEFDRLFLLTGMAAALSALLHAPIASAVFVMEVSRLRLKQARYYLPIAIASFEAYGIAAIFNLDMVGKSIPIPDWSWSLLAYMTIISVAVALAGGLFCVLLRVLRKACSRIPHSPYVSVVAVGVLIAVGTLFLHLQDFGGPGLNLIADALYGASDPMNFVWKFLCTLLVLAAGFKGGEIMPSFAMGATAGAALAALFGVDVTLAAAVGLVVMFASVTNCPIASAILGFEFFGLAAVPYCVVGCALAYLITHRVSLFDNQEHLLPRHGTKHIE